MVERIAMSDGMDSVSRPAEPSSKEDEAARADAGISGYLGVAEALRESEECFRFLAETATDAVLLLDENARILFWNAAAVALFGYKQEEALGKQAHLFLGTGVDSAPVEELQRIGCDCSSTKGSTVEFVTIRKDGSRIPVELSSSWFSLGENLRSVVFARDISGRKTAEQEIIDAKSRLEFILESCRAAIYTAKPYGTYQSTYKSESIKDLTGYGPGSFTGDPDFWWSHIHPEDADYAYKEVETVFEKGQHEYEYRFRHIDGTYRWIRDEMRLVRDEEGNPKEIVGSLSDVTELRNAREQMELSREQLRSLAAQIESLREGERRMIAREIHDEFGQALTGLKLDLKWLEKKISVNEGEVRERVSSMLVIVDSNIELVRRISSRLRPGVLDDLGLAAAVEWQVGEFGRKTSIDCSLSSTMLEVRYDDDMSTALFRILQEALTNVARHADATRVEVELGEQDGHLVLEVRDNGRGIEPSELHDTGSLGILSMRERALLLGGEVFIEGSRGEGTTVRVQVPVEAQEVGGEAECREASSWKETAPG